MRGNLEDLIIKFQPTSEDWMGFTVSRKNPYCYHHIIPRRDGGKKRIENGAILTKKSHRYLHWLENEDPQLYAWYQCLFESISTSNLPPNDNHKHIMQKLKSYYTKEQNKRNINSKEK